MSFSVNSIILGGHLGADPEERRTAAGKLVCNLRLATNRWDSRTDEPVTDWHTVVAYEKQAENCVKYLRKGSALLVEGRLTQRDWTSSDGKKQTRHEVIASRVTFVGGRSATTERIEQPAAESPVDRPAYREPRSHSHDTVPF